MFGHKKIKSDNLIESTFNRLENGAFHMVDGRLFWKNGDHLISYEISEDENGQFFMYPATAALHRSPFLENLIPDEEECHEYETRSLMWMASFGKYVTLKED